RPVHAAEGHRTNVRPPTSPRSAARHIQSWRRQGIASRSFSSTSSNFAPPALRPCAVGAGSALPQERLPVEHHLHRGASEALADDPLPVNDETRGTPLTPQRV